MIVVLRRGATDAQRDEIVRELERYGLGVRALVGGGKPLLHVTSGPTRRAQRVLAADVVEALVPTSGPRLRRQGHRIYPYYFIRWCAAGVAIFGLMVFMAGYFPPGTGPEVQLQDPPATLGWPWYVRAPLAILRSFPPEQRWMAWSLILLLCVVTVLLPVLDRTRGADLRHRWPFAGAATALVGVVVYFALWGAP